MHRHLPWLATTRRPAFYQHLICRCVICTICSSFSPQIYQHTQRHCLWVPVDISPRVKQLKRDSNHRLAGSIEVENKWALTSTFFPSWLDIRMTKVIKTLPKKSGSRRILHYPHLSLRIVQYIYIYISTYRGWNPNSNKLVGPNMTVPPPVLSLSSILPSPSSRCALIPSSKNSAKASNTLFLSQTLF